MLNILFDNFKRAKRFSGMNTFVFPGPKLIKIVTGLKEGRDLTSPNREFLEG
jgi:hypothetical protein